MSEEEPQRKPWHKLPSGIDLEHERLADERIQRMRDTLAANNFEPLKEPRRIPIIHTPEEIDEGLRKAREEWDGEPMEYDPIMDYCSM